MIDIDWLGTPGKTLQSQNTTLENVHILAVVTVQTFT